MKLPKNLYKLATVDVSSLEKELNKLTPEQWVEWDLRQNRYVIHQLTETYPLMFSEYGEPPTLYNQNTPLWHVTQPLVSSIELLYGKKPAAILFAKLKAGASIPRHKDGGWFVKTHRLHIPIITDPRVIFSIGDDTYHLEKGVVYEFNNMNMHGVTNPTNIDRVHLMIDLFNGLKPTTFDYDNIEVKQL